MTKFVIDKFLRFFAVFVIFYTITPPPINTCSHLNYRRFLLCKILYFIKVFAIGRKSWWKHFVQRFYVILKKTIFKCRCRDIFSARTKLRGCNNSLGWNDFQFADSAAQPSPLRIRERIKPMKYIIADKLNFLMKVTGTKNNMLGRALSFPFRCLDYRYSIP